MSGSARTMRNRGLKMQLVYDIGNVLNDGGADIAIVLLAFSTLRLRAEVRALRRAMGVRDTASVARVREKIMREVGER